MYNDNIKVANKIISDRDLFDIFQLMNEKIKEYTQVYNQEKIQNERYDREYQHWTVKDFEGTFKANIDFYDDTTIDIDNYTSFITIYNTRLQDIKSMRVRYRYAYWIQDGKSSDMISKYIDMDIYEYKMNIDVKIPSVDDKMNDIYKLIEAKILNAPERYDFVVKKKNSIENKASFASGIIPSLVICTLLAFMEPVRELYFATYVVYPVVVLILSLLIGSLLTGGQFDKLYSTIKPSQKYSGYDSDSGKSIYKDDIEDYVSKSEIIIGKNINNLKNREEIIKLNEKYSKRIPMSILLVLVASIGMIVVGFIIG